MRGSRVSCSGACLFTSHFLCESLHSTSQVMLHHHELSCSASSSKNSGKFPKYKKWVSFSSPLTYALVFQKYPLGRTYIILLLQIGGTSLWGQISYKVAVFVHNQKNTRLSQNLTNNPLFNQVLCISCEPEIVLPVLQIKTEISQCLPLVKNI